MPTARTSPGTGHGMGFRQRRIRRLMLKLTALGVGNGDATLLQWFQDGDPDKLGFTCLVDGGESPSRLLPALDRHGVTEINLLVLTHFDADHIGGLDGIWDHCKIHTCWAPCLNRTTDSILVVRKKFVRWEIALLSFSQIWIWLIQWGVAPLTSILSRPRFLSVVCDRFGFIPQPCRTSG